MKPFSQIAIPHKDIIEGRLSMDVFAADLWKVVKGQAIDEYQNKDVFFRKTFITDGLKNLLNIAEKRLKSANGDPVIQLQTPFGGGKTHTLIALYHKAKEWNAKVVVIDGTALDPRVNTLWEEIEKQLKGNVSSLKGKISPGREKLEKILSKHQPILFLVDELLQYTTKAAGVKVENSNLASQTLAFIQELTVTISTLDKTLLVLTLPSSVLEHYDENAEKLFQQLQKITGRVEKIYTPVQDDEVSQVIRRRLFREINESDAKEIIENFLDYADKEAILPIDKPLYRERFLKSYPFQPEVIDILYKRWGSFPTFQRTRGVLRILALVVHSLKEKNIPFIRLSDFDLGNEEIRRELIKHIGSEYESVIYADITSKDSGSKKVDQSLGDTYRAFSFGTKISTSIFLHSFSGGKEKGATLSELKLSCADPDIPSTIITEAITKLKDNLFYLSDSGLFFTNQPNMNRILLTKIETIEPNRIKDEVKEILQQSFTEKHFEIFIWPRDTKDIPDTNKLKLVVLEDKNKAKDFLENYGNTSRVYRNTLIFLCPSESEITVFNYTLTRKLAWEMINKDQSLTLTEDKKKEIKEKIKRFETDLKSGIRNLYRLVLLPVKEGLKEIDLGLSAYGSDTALNEEVYESLKNENEIIEKLSPDVLLKKYLSYNEYVETKQIIESFYKTPGEIRITNENVLINAIKSGVKEGKFQLGVLENGNPKPYSNQHDVDPTFSEGEILILAESIVQIEVKNGDQEGLGPTPSDSDSKEPDTPPPPPPIHVEKIQEIEMDLIIPKFKTSDLTRVLNYIYSQFNQVELNLHISASEGEITKEDYENKIIEALEQAGIKIVKKFEK